MSARKASAPAENSVKVAVRVRPFNNRERAAGSVNVISMEGNTTSIRGSWPPPTEARPLFFLPFIVMISIINIISAFSVPG
jgi:hypothetical protein